MTSHIEMCEGCEVTSGRKDRTIPRFTDETLVTSCGWRVTCGPSLPCRCEDQRAKQLLNDADMPDAKKVQALWRKLQSEHELARSVTEDSHAKIRQIREPDADLETTQAEVNRGYGVTVKLESLCRRPTVWWRREKAAHRDLVPKQCVDSQRPSQRSNSEIHFLIHEVWSERH